MRGGELSRRLAVAAVGIPLILAALYLGGWVLGGGFALFAAAGAREFYRMAEARGGRPFQRLGIAMAAGLVLLATLESRYEGFAPPAGVLILSVGLFVLGTSVWRRWPDGHPLDDTATTLVGALYTGGTLAFVPLLHALPASLGVETDPWRSGAFVLLPLLTTWAGDSAAYFVGHAIGRTRLAPHVSPGKTVEGAIAGLLGAMVAAGVVAWWGPAHFEGARLGVATALGVGLLLGAAALVGDLAESVLKRDAGIKDSGAVLPGHGGALDRLDSLLFAFPVAWLLLHLPGVLR